MLGRNNEQTTKTKEGNLQEKKKKLAKPSLMIFSIKEALKRVFVFFLYFFPTIFVFNKKKKTSALEI